MLSKKNKRFLKFMRKAKMPFLVLGILLFVASWLAPQLILHNFKIQLANNDRYALKRLGTIPAKTDLELKLKRMLLEDERNIVATQRLLIFATQNIFSSVLFFSGLFFLGMFFEINSYDSILRELNLDIKGDSK